MRKLFRERLEKGMQGTDVAALQGFLLGADFVVDDGLVPHGQYGKKTVSSVKELRVQAGLEAEEGQFDLRLKEKLKKGVTGILPIDFDSFTIETEGSVYYADH